MDGVAMTHGQSGDSENVSHEARLLDLNWKHNYTTNGGIRKTFRKIVNESRLWCRVRAMQIHSKKAKKSCLSHTHNWIADELGVRSSSKETWKRLPMAKQIEVS